MITKISFSAHPHAKPYHSEIGVEWVCAEFACSFAGKSIYLRLNCVKILALRYIINYLKKNNKIKR